MRSRGVFVLCAIVLAVVLNSDRSAQAGELEEQLRDQLQQKLSGAINEETNSFDIKRLQRNSLGIIGGNSFTGHGKTGVAEIKGKIEGEGLNTKFVYECTVPWSGEWHNKSWYPVNQYRSEKKNQSGKIFQKYRIHLVGGKVEVLESKVTEASDATGHDSVKMPVNALLSKYLNNEAYLRTALFE